MTRATQTISSPIPSEVLSFASEQGVSSLLPAVAEMTQRIFPCAEVAINIDDDPEIANDRHIVLAVRASNLEVPQALEARYHWHRDLFACCPAPLVWVFRLGLELTQ